MDNNNNVEKQNNNGISEEQPDLVYKKNRLVDMFFGGLFGAIGGFIGVVVGENIAWRLGMPVMTDVEFGGAIMLGAIGGASGMGLWYNAWPWHRRYHGATGFFWAALFVGILGYVVSGWNLAALLGLSAGVGGGGGGFLGSCLSMKFFSSKKDALLNKNKIYHRKTEQLFNRNCFMDMIFGGIFGVIGGGIGALSGAVVSDVAGASAALDYYGYDVGYAIVFGGLGAVLGMVGLWYRPLNTLTAYNVYAAIIGAALFAGLGGLDSGGGGLALAVIMSVFAGWFSGIGGSWGVRISMELFD